MIDEILQKILYIHYIYYIYGSGHTYLCTVVMFLLKIFFIPYRSYNTPHEYRFLPCGVTAKSFIYFFLSFGMCGIGVNKDCWVAASHERQKAPLLPRPLALVLPPPRPPPRPSSSSTCGRKEDFSAGHTQLFENCSNSRAADLVEQLIQRLAQTQVGKTLPKPCLDEDVGRACVAGRSS
jgi:hypothetical protein